ncbi:hypothetical protein IX39_06765 [Chryseobacterium formosense]|uniref:Glycosyltransferase 2-like domain-containing protein n=1 Tax=Chryseobacterium formosense TaxID=236814 RepID=A0A085Z7D9_9FLAO|nr:glycosyltransferase [Chryseobacterium formosense]KFF00353.1 hypothetical protein IX39_06765 [Chryseobacterium formosense]SFT33138.1 hypothetical protein SAMN05421857_0060 [Chryseobacterium formosense]
MIKISTIIVTYNSLDLIKDCIESVNQNNDLNEDEIEIIVVDNSDDPKEGEAMRDFLSTNYGDSVIFIKNKNLGYGEGNNVGVRKAKGEIIAIMNPDIRLTEPLFKKTLQHFSDKDISSLGYKQINNVSDYSFFKMPEFFVPVLTSYYIKLNNRKEKFNQYKYYLSGAFVFFRKEDFVKIGMYDPNFFLFYEEADVAQRINKINKKIIYDKSKSYLHLMGHKDAFHPKMLDIGSDSIKKYFTKYNLNLRGYINKRIWELYFYKLLFTLNGNKQRVEKADAYIDSLKKINY